MNPKDLYAACTDLLLTLVSILMQRVTWSIAQKTPDIYYGMYHPDELSVVRSDDLNTKMRPMGFAVVAAITERETAFDAWLISSRGGPDVYEHHSKETVEEMFREMRPRTPALVAYLEEKDPSVDQLLAAIAFLEFWRERIWVELQKTGDAQPGEPFGLATEALRELLPSVSAPGDDEPRMTWQVARIRGEEHIDRNPYPGVRALARLINCGTTTMLKAIRRSPKLLNAHNRAMAERRGISTGGMTEVAMATIPQAVELDPADAAALSEPLASGVDDLTEKLILAARPSERDGLRRMLPAQLRELAATAFNDPDAPVRGRSR